MTAREFTNTSSGGNFSSADFAACILDAGSNDGDSKTTNDANDANDPNSPFNSEDFHKFLKDNRRAILGNAGSPSSLETIFKSSKLFKSQQYSDLFKSQPSFSQIFQSKDSIVELFRSLDDNDDNDDGGVAPADAGMAEPALPALPALDPVAARSTSNGASFLQSKDWKNLGTHVDVAYQPSKLFRDTSSRFGEDSNDGESSSSRPAQPQQPTVPPKTNWGDFFFAQLHPGAEPTPAAAAAAASSSTSSSSTTVTPVATSRAATLPVPPSVASAVALPPSASKSKKKSSGGGAAAARLPARKQDRRYIRNPTKKDILMGRGGKSNHHPGNRRYREEILNFKTTYAALGSKEEKTNLSRQVVDYVHRYQGRFLALDASVQPPRWYEINDALARRKVSQALREDVDPSKRKEKRDRYLRKKRGTEQEERRQRRQAP